MKSIRLKSLLLALLLVLPILTSACGETPDVTTPEATTPEVTTPDSSAGEENTIKDTEIFTTRQSVLMIGQSNMAGRGDLNIVETIKDDRIFMMRNGRFIPMQEPIHDDKPTIAGASLGASFAKAFVETFDCELGLIPGAYGGTSLADWEVGGQYYRRALNMAKAAQETSEICAILWHQGEGDGKTSDYTGKLKVILDAFIKDLGLDPDKIVIITGELGRFRSHTYVNSSLVALGTYYKNYGVASSAGLTAQDVTTHFDAPSLRVFGYRFFDIFYNRITGKNYSFNDDPSSYLVVPEEVEEDLGDYIAKESFNSYVAGRTYTSATTVGNVKIAPKNDSYIEVIAASGNDKDKYLGITCAAPDDSPYIDITNETAAGTDVTVEAKFMRSAEFDGCGDLLKLVQSSPKLASIALMHVNKRGELCDIVGSKIGDSFGVTLSEFEWTHVKIVCHLASNTKDVYINGILYGEGLKLLSSASDAAAFNTARTRVMQYKASGIGTIYFDDYKAYN